MATASLGANSASSKPRTKLLAALRKSDSSDSSESSADSASDGSDSEDMPTTTSSLLEPRPQPKAQSPEAEEEVDAESAYQRMKQRLAAEKESQQQRAQKDEPVIVAALSSDDEEEMPTRKPVRKSILAKQQPSSVNASPTPSVRSRQSSPGLFVSPHPSPVKRRSPIGASADSNSDPSSQRAAAADLQDRVKRIKAERLAKQKEEETQRATKPASRRSPDQDAGSDTDGEIDRRLTQQSKPTRRAGKKALEAMARDQQRISRNMQLTHQSKTKKRYSTKDLFTKFGFNAPNDGTATAPPTPEPISALVSSDIEAQPIHDTPPTSPPHQDGATEKAMLEDGNSTPKATVIEQADDATPVPTRTDKGKGRAPEFAHLPTRTWGTHAQPVTVQHAQVRAVTPLDDAMVELSDSDDGAKAAPKSRFAVFDRIRTKEQDDSKSFVTLRHLAHLTSPKNTRKGPRTISRSEMHFSLAQKARQQAQKMREERLEELKRRGIHVETAEEREKNQIEIEDIVAQFEKQRQKDLKLAKLEKKEAEANGMPIDELPSSDESDDDYVASGEENMVEGDDDDQQDEEAELDLSGSEDESMEDEDAEDVEASNNLIDGAAEEDEQSEVEDAPMPDELADEDDEHIAPVRKQTVKRSRRVVDDEDESDDDAPKPGSPTQKATQDDAKAVFGFGNSNTGLGLTQMFAGTMANLDDSQATYQEPEQDSLDFLRSLPDTQPGANSSQADDTLVPNSQSLMSPRKELQTGAESQFSLGISQVVGPSPSRTQFSEAPEPTQDAGFSFSRSPAGFMAPISTMDTVMMSVAESPIKKRTGKLQRGRREAAVELSDIEENLIDAASDMSDVDDIQRPPKHRDAFRAMQKGAKKQRAIDEFNKKTSLAKNVVEEQADESEDEYAGIGGISDDESGEEDDELKNMIDHSEVKVDERQIAAFYADKSKKDDEKNINQLYKDLMNGGLRKRAGRDAFDMSDSEDEAEMKQRKKRADFARMQKALMSDENIGKIAENPKQQAFFKTLADFADDADYDFLEMPEPKSIYAEDSESQSQLEQIQQDGAEGETVVPDSQLAASQTDSVVMPPPNLLKRKSPSSSQKENRAPPNLRRVDNGLTRRPITLADVQHSVSELLEDSRIVVPDSQYASDSDSELEIVDRPMRKAVVDRLTLSRQSTLEESQSQSSAEGLAFHAPSRSATGPGFRIPSLIRQATSTLSATSERSERHSQSGEAAVRRGGTGRSNIHAQAREAERRALLEKKEKKRKEVLRKKVDGARRKGGMRSVLGDLGGGFE
ncbi:uncharacterized protein EKO05_0005624 [Ascochyta rabiei]|uniref:Uncharacterized protein n=1 Tax=Didymella rabiei TaxID=5454 RepID=A0A163FGH2_DIDRA|nr:uncharacterized protein EKO05_0005624 [Ascochyta rabiei]KZM24347.1 hypothetical protein ST47_g4514 [Ascochyta rabiei]UPX15167.1 hypothetical protein EKO05_0005624 [Ascochyta rabiei]